MIDRTLVIMRHAHAADGEWTDHDRPLTGRGQREAASQGALALSAGWSMPHVLCSDATRTRQTLAICAQALGAVPVVVTSSRLYLPAVSAMREELASAPDHTWLWLVSHNPSCEDLVTHLCGQRVALPPATMVRLSGRGATWREAVDAPWHLLDARTV